MVGLTIETNGLLTDLKGQTMTEHTSNVYMDDTKICVKKTG
jgi:hypothetical protein